MSTTLENEKDKNIIEFPTQSSVPEEQDATLSASIAGGGTVTSIFSRTQCNGSVCALNWSPRKKGEAA